MLNGGVYIYIILSVWIFSRCKWIVFTLLHSFLFYYYKSENYISARFYKRAAKSFIHNSIAHLSLI